MELQILNQPTNGVATPKESPFIEANTEVAILDDLRDNHIIPVFVKDNSPLISQLDFIQTTLDITDHVMGKKTAAPSIRVSHPIKGRIPEARNKKASELLDHEKTIYYERMAFIAEIPAFKEQVNGQELTMTVGGVKAYNEDNIYNVGGAFQRFRIFIGFKVRVCTNLSIWTDGYSQELKVRSLTELGEKIHELVQGYQSETHLNFLRNLTDYELTEQQFAMLIGKARLYNHLPTEKKKEIPELLISDSQISTVARQYYKDEHFRGKVEQGINLWNLYNLLTDSVKSSYIDTFLDRNANALTFTQGIAQALDGEGNYHWFLN